MTPEKEIELFETVATISADLKHMTAAQSDMNTKLSDHTVADHENFEKLSVKIDALTTKLNISDALKADNLEDAKKVASRKATVVSVIVSAISVVLGAWLQRLLNLS